MGREPLVAEWVGSIPVSQIYTTVLNLWEIDRRIVRMEIKDQVQGTILRDWFESRVLPSFGDRVLLFDQDAARRAARLPIPHAAPVDDGLIAAIAAANNMTLVTRNIKHFEGLGVQVVNPWARP